MKLTANQERWLRVLNEGPAFTSHRCAPKHADEHKLWLAGFIDLIGRSFYITDKGRALLEELDGTESEAGR